MRSRLIGVFLAVWCTATGVARAFEPTKLALEINAVDGQVASAQLSQQFGFPVMLAQAGGLTYTGEPQPFAVAFKAFLEKSNLTCQARGNGMGLTPGQPLRVLTVGDSVAVVIARATLVASASPGGSGTARYDLEAFVVCDPALEFVGTGRTIMIDALEVDGHAVATPEGVGFDPYGLSQALINQPGAQSIPLSFTTPGPAKRLTKVSARLRAWQVAEAAAVDLPVDDIATGKSSEKKDLTVTAAMPVVNTRPALNVTLSGAAAERYRDGQWSQALQKFVRLLDKDGRPLSGLSSGGITRSGSDGGLTVTMRADRRNNSLSDLATISVKLPTKVRCVDVPLEITDLDLPGGD